MHHSRSVAIATLAALTVACGNTKKHDDSVAAVAAQRARDDSARARDAAAAWQKWAADSARGVAYADSVRRGLVAEQSAAASTVRAMDSIAKFVQPGPGGAAAVSVCVEMADSVVTYRYTVENRSTHPSRIWEIGAGNSFRAVYTDASDGGGELARLPVRFKYNPEGDNRLDTLAASGPASWSATVERFEETRGYFVKWDARANEFAIKPGQSAVFVIRVPAPGDSAYMRGHFTLDVDGEPFEHIGRVVRLPC